MNSLETILPALKKEFIVEKDDELNALKINYPGTNFSADIFIRDQSVIVIGIKTIMNNHEGEYIRGMLEKRCAAATAERVLFQGHGPEYLMLITPQGNPAETINAVYDAVSFLAKKTYVPQTAAQSEK